MNALEIQGFNRNQPAATQSESPSSGTKENSKTGAPYCRTAFELSPLRDEPANQIR